MALIQCPKCGRDISNKALICPHCQEVLKQEERAKIYCQECGEELDSEDKVCHKCGCPVEILNETISENDKRISRKKIIILVGIAIAVILAVFGGMSIKKKNDEKRAIEEARQLAEDYKMNLVSITTEILEGAEEAEEAGNLIHDVWYNSIFEERDDTTDQYTRPDGYFVSDFNTALQNLFDDPSFQADLFAIEENKENVQELMKQMQSPPEEHKEAYEALKDLYESYLNFTTIVTDPSGNLNTFTSNFNEADTEVVNFYTAMTLYF